MNSPSTVANTAIASNSNSRKSEHQTLLDRAYADLQAGNFQSCADTLNAAQRLDNTIASTFFIGGLLAQKVGNPLAGIIAYEQAIARDAKNAAAMYNLADCLIEVGREDDGENFYRAALSVDEGFAPAYVNLGNRHFTRAEYTEALGLYRGALTQDPLLPQALDAEAICLAKLGRWQEAINSNHTAIVRAGISYARAERALSFYDLLGQPESKAAFLSPYIEDPVYGFMHTAISGSKADNAVTMTPHAFVEAHFDWRAATYDAEAIANNYIIPGIISQELFRLPANGKVLDLGCGTGFLAGYPLTQPLQLTGVDVSSAMLAQAKNRGGYHALHHQSAEAFMAQSDADTFDAVVAADLLPYVGRPEGILAQSAQVLRVGGLLFVSIEANEDSEASCLQASYRFNHPAPAFLSRAEQLGFRLLKQVPLSQAKQHLYCLQKLG